MKRLGPELVIRNWLKECIEFRYSAIDKQNLHAEITREKTHVATICYILAISKVILGCVPICDTDSVHS